MSKKTDFIMGMCLISFIIFLFMAISNFFAFLVFTGLFKEIVPTNIDLQDILKYILMSILLIIDILVIKKVIKYFVEMYKFKMIDIKENKTKYNSYGPSYNTSSDDIFDGFSGDGDCCGGCD